jgi:hypothetical protein
VHFSRFTDTFCVNLHEMPCKTQPKHVTARTNFKRTYQVSDFDRGVFFYKCDLYCAPVAMRLHFLKEIFGFKGTLSQEKSVYSSETFSNLFDRPFQNQ